MLIVAVQLTKREPVRLTGLSVDRCMQHCETGNESIDIDDDGVAEANPCFYCSGRDKCVLPGGGRRTVDYTETCCASFCGGNVPDPVCADGSDNFSVDDVRNGDVQECPLTCPVWLEDNPGRQIHACPSGNQCLASRSYCALDVCCQSVSIYGVSGPGIVVDPAPSTECCQETQLECLGNGTEAQCLQCQTGADCEGKPPTYPPGFAFPAPCFNAEGMSPEEICDRVRQGDAVPCNCLVGMCAFQVTACFEEEIGGGTGGDTGTTGGDTGGSSSSGNSSGNSTSSSSSSSSSSLSSSTTSSIPSSVSSFSSSFSLSQSSSVPSSVSSILSSSSSFSFSDSLSSSMSSSSTSSVSSSSFSFSESFSFSSSFSLSSNTSSFFSSSFSFTPSSTSFSFSNSFSSSSSRSFVVDACTGDECVTFGDGFCSIQNRNCITIPGAPCFTCIDRTSSSSSFSNSFSDSFSVSSAVSSANSNSFSFSTTSSSLSLTSSNAFSFSSSFSSTLPCFSDFDCPSDLLCIAGECTGGCTNNVDCPSGSCVNGVCSNQSSSIIIAQNTCGNFRLDLGEQCDDGNAVSRDGCSAFCQLEAPGCYFDFDCATGRCINGSCIPCVTDSECAIGRCINNSCQIPTLTAATSLCGNGILELPEECDDSNTRDNDGCNNTCLLEIGVCGDGKVQKLLGEQCESSLHNPSLPYSCKNCRFSSDLCGDGNTDPGEECDEGQRNSLAPDATCRPDCSRARCGDSILDSAELCDDGNTRSSDGCDRFCRVESPNSLVASQNITFPSQNTTQPLPFQLPLASLQPLIQSQAPIGDTGPAAVAVIGAGAASGIAWVRRKRRK